MKRERRSSSERGAMLDILAEVHARRERGERFVLATVVRAEKPTSAKAGAKAIITEAGELIGWIGGSCAQPTVPTVKPMLTADMVNRQMEKGSDLRQYHSNSSEIVITSGKRYWLSLICAL